MHSLRQARSLAVVLTLAFAGTTCRDMTGSTGPGRLAPTGAALAFSSVVPAETGEPVIPVHLARVRLFRLPGEIPERAVLDTVLPFADLDSARTLTVGLTLTMVSERFGIELSLLDDRAQVIYQARDTVVAYTTNEAPVSKPILLKYAGPDTVVARIALAPGDTSLAIGEAISLRASAFRRDGVQTSARFGYVVHGSGAITVDAAGTLRAIAPVARGSAWIVARIATGLADSVTIGAQVPAAGIEVSPAEGTTAVGGRLRLTAIAWDSSGAVIPGRQPTWTSSDTNLAIVSDGVVFGRKVGTVAITARSERAVARSIVAVTPTRVARVVPSLTVLTVVVGSTATVSVRPIDSAGVEIPGRVALWSVRDPRLAFANPVGDPASNPIVVRGLMAGTTTLDVNVEGVRATVGLVVKPKPAGRVTVVPDAAALLVNEAITAAVAVRDSDGVVQPARAVVWRSLDPAVATVDDAGTLTGRSPGRTGVVAAVDSAADTLSVIVRRISRMTITQTGATTPSAVDTMTFALVALDQSGAVIDGQSAEWTIVGTGILLARAGAGTRVVQHGSTPFVLTASVLNDEATLTVQPPGGSSLPPVPQPPASQPPAHRDEH